MRLDINQIKEIIPHRHPFLLLDYIEDYEPAVISASPTERNSSRDISPWSL